MAEEIQSDNNENLQEKFNDEEQNVILANSLALIPEAERNEIQKVVKTADIVLIETHKVASKKLKKKFPAKNFQITENMVYNKALHDKAIEAERTVRNYRTKTAEVDFENLKAPYLTLLNFYNKSIKPVVDELKDTQAPISEFVKKMKKLKEDEDEKEEREREQRTQQRVKDIIAAGAAFDSSYYSAGSTEFEIEPISIGMADINTMSDDLYNNFFEQLKTKVAAINLKQKAKDDAAEVDRKNKEQELEKLKEQNLRVRARELKALGFVPSESGESNSSNGIVITKKQLEDLGMEEWETLMNETETKIENQKAEVKKRELVTARTNEVLAAGLIKTITGFISTYKDLEAFINFNDLETLEEDKWNEFIIEAKDTVSRQKTAKFDDDKIESEQKELATIREQELSPYWQFVTAEEKITLGKIAADVYSVLFERVKKSDADKKTKDLVDKTAKDAKDKQEVLEKEGDVSMYNDLVVRLQGLYIPPVKTDQYKGLVGTITKFINGLKVIDANK